MSIKDLHFQSTEATEKFSSINIKKLADDAKELEQQIFKSMIDSFAGIRVEVDEELRDLEYYVMVSPKLYKELNKQVSTTEVKNYGRPYPIE